MTTSQIIDALRASDRPELSALQWAQRDDRWRLTLGGAEVGRVEEIANAFTRRPSWFYGVCLGRRAGASFDGARDHAIPRCKRAAEDALLGSVCLGDGTTVAEALREGTEPAVVAEWLLQWEGKTA